MLIEVEQKARVAEPDSIKDILVSRFGAGVDIDKEDQYFWLDDGSSLSSAKKVRLRRESDGWTCTVKEKSIENGTEKNREIEFPVSDIVAFRRFLDYLGFSFLCSKRKTGWKFTVDDMCVELCEVHSLGWFLEVEIICEESAVPDAEKKISSFMSDMGLASSIEARTYLSLLCGDGV